METALDVMADVPIASTGLSYLSHNFADGRMETQGTPTGGNPSSLYLLAVGFTWGRVSLPMRGHARNTGICKGGTCRLSGSPPLFGTQEVDHGNRTSRLHPQ